MSDIPQYKVIHCRIPVLQFNLNSAAKEGYELCAWHNTPKSDQNAGMVVAVMERWQKTNALPVGFSPTIENQDQLHEDNQG